MLYMIRHTTTYRYRSDVSTARCVLHLLPISRGNQLVHAAELSIEPLPVERIDGLDFFGNEVAHVRFAAPARRHRFESSLRVEVQPAELVHALLTPDWREARDDALAIPDLSAASPAHFLFASRYVPLLDAARDYAARSFSAGRPVLDGAMELMARIRSDFVYDPEATDVTTPLQDL
jgi:transglutaminase-like putative cysteine protease